MNRPLSVAGHHEWRESLAAPDSRFDEIDDHAADPILDRLPVRRGEVEANRLLAILDSLPVATDGQERGRG